MTSLSVNLNKIALLRNSRDSGLPSVVQFATSAIESGADGITVHPRPDKRHIRRSDVHDLDQLLKTAFPHVEFNIEGNPLEPSFVEIIRSIKPTQCTLVPDARDQLTSDHGWELDRTGEELRPLIAEFQSLGVRVSLFMDDAPQLMARAKDLGADRIELYTGPYAEACSAGHADLLLQRHAEAARAATAAGLGINAGHDLSLENLGPYLAHVPGVQEVSIGHALTIDALVMGWQTAVARYAAICHA